MNRIWRHFRTITHHKRLVLQGCFRVGMYWQGITHDLSKFSPAEFCVGIRYWTGKRSPNAGERQEKGYSTAWMHHKGRNRHHWNTGPTSVPRRAAMSPAPCRENIWRKW